MNEVTLRKLGGGINKAVDAVGDAFEEETVFTVCVRDTFAIEDHKVDLTIKNTRAWAVYRIRLRANREAEERGCYIVLPLAKLRFSAAQFGQHVMGPRKTIVDNNPPKTP